ncbi:MAG: hypothetical protein NVS4B7_02690 [Ktedonobacteraceae bacterium]
MKPVLSKKSLTKIDTHLSVHRNKQRLLSWFFSWEIYLILLVAGFLRLYQLNTSEFDADQAAIFGMAREAVRSGLLPIVSNRASIGIENPPVVIYLLMIPAALSANPFWAIVMVGLLNTLAVLLTYFFTRRYYGRLAGAVAALLYAAAAKPLSYSRAIWQQNMLAPFIVLFLLALFWGAIERRKGWFAPAVALLGIMYQLHETSTLLAIPLLVTVVLAPQTVRWRDLAFAFISLFVLFALYIFWEFSSHFSDASTLLQVAKLHPHIDTYVITLYKTFLSPYGYASYDHLSPSPTSVLRLCAPILPWLRRSLLLLAIGGLVIAVILALWPQRNNLPLALVHAGQAKQTEDKEVTTSPDYFAIGKNIVALLGGVRPSLPALRNWWIQYRATPYRCGLTLLCIWQVAPLLLFLRHTIILFPYYLLILMPGPFILMGLFFAQCVQWTQRRHWYWRGLRYGIYAVMIGVIIGQIVTCTATLIDAVYGNTGHGRTFNDLSSLQHALNEADQLARQRHLNRVYITTDNNSQIAMQYLSEQMQTPTTLFDDARCLLLPNVSDGPAVFLLSPYAQLTAVLLQQFASATLVDRPARLGAPPFQLYFVTPKRRFQQVSLHEAFANHLQLVDVQHLPINVSKNSSWVVADWHLLRSAQSSPYTTYNYAFAARITTLMNYSGRSLCTLTSMRPGDQLDVAFALPKIAPTPALVHLEAQFYTNIPYNPTFGPFHLETDQTYTSPKIPLHTTEGKDSFDIPIS